MGRSMAQSPETVKTDGGVTSQLINRESITSQILENYYLLAQTSESHSGSHFAFPWNSTRQEGGSRTTPPSTPMMVRPRPRRRIPNRQSTPGPIRSWCFQQIRAFGF